MIDSLESFGDVEGVGKKLLDVERAKESTLTVDMLAQVQYENAQSHYMGTRIVQLRPPLPPCANTSAMSPPSLAGKPRLPLRHCVRF
jgi:hypothetical protein